MPRAIIAAPSKTPGTIAKPALATASIRAKMTSPQPTITTAKKPLK